MRTYRRLSYIFFGCFLFMGQSASGQTSVPEVCKDAKTQREMNECLASAYRDADQELNALYASLRNKLRARGHCQTARGAKAWVKYRDTNCEAEAGLYEGGSIQPAVGSGCLERVTRGRIAELHMIYDTGNR